MGNDSVVDIPYAVEMKAAHGTIAVAMEGAEVPRENYI